MRKYRVTDHAIAAAKHRFDKTFGVQDLAHTSKESLLLFTTDTGEQYRWCQSKGHDVVCVIKGRNIVTVVTLAMAFSDCPKAVFLALLENNCLVTALALRAKGEMKYLPRSIERKYCYRRRRAEILWNTFHWMK